MADVLGTRVIRKERAELELPGSARGTHRHEDQAPIEECWVSWCLTTLVHGRPDRSFQLLQRIGKGGECYKLVATLIHYQR